ncbi:MULTISPECIES: response regulator transcription factor [Aestuariibaculum]|uniref:Response regulator transcription factor n=1 Tax=Aestuariibaculum lutulentum TaxID=2920935 RepID=A0ABS9RI71_9FLAO|nr:MULTISPECIES: response regulator transcription factor [Aestuariibaculum]MCH4552655.1 response regulator transcription factor [Aestuariibaculum lutulentum]MCR8668110.1 response regulator transcription factor [Aestuariibaculum sp. M13]
MFKKVLIVDDHDVVSEGVLSILNQNDITNVVQAQYCDEAHLKVKRAVLDAEPFDLLITDLSFKQDYQNTTLESGEDLAAVLKDEFPELPIIVYSMEDRLQKVRTLINTHGVNGYVCKSRKGALELSQAIKQVANQNIFLSPQVENALNQNNELEIDDYDIELIKQLSMGFSQGEISQLFKSKKMVPSSLSSIEKRINKLKDVFKANNTIHLVAILKDLGLI